MIEIDRSKCKKMLVWDDGCEKVERIVLFHTGNVVSVVSEYDEESFLKGECYDINFYKNVAPLPEQKPMTALDVMWWAGIRKVGKPINSDTFWCISAFSSKDLTTVGSYEIQQWNELIRENGETKLKYEQWKPFTFDECDMGEG